VIDPRKRQIDLAALEKVVESDLHAIDRGSRKSINLHTVAFRHFAQEKRIIDRYRLTHTALRRFGGNGDHPAELACDLKERLNTS